MNKKQIITIIIASAIGSTVAAVVPRLINGSKEFQINQGLVKACNEIGKNCPMIIDKYTRLDGAVSGNNEITYLYTITNLSDKQAINIKDKIIESATAFAKSKPETLNLLNNGVTMKYCYKNNLGNVLYEFSVNK